MRLNTLSFAIALSLMLSSFAATAAETCGVPICDMSKAVSTFMSAPLQEQQKIIAGYSNEASRSTSAPALKNLSEFAATVKQSATKTHLEKSMLSAIAQLASLCSQGLAKYSMLDSRALLVLYSQLTHGNNRYDVLNYWTAKIKEIEDKDQLLELTRFFSGAAAQSTDFEDDDYITQLAKSSEQSAARKLFRLQPIYEGVYSIRISCEDKSKKCPAAEADKMVIIDPLVGDNFEVDVVVSSLRTFIHRFTNISVTGGGTALEGTGRNYATGALSKLHLDFNIVQGSFEGYIDTADERLNISGTIDPQAWLGQMFDNQISRAKRAEIPKELFNGVLRGLYRGKRVGLKINIFQDDMVGATMTIDELPQFKLRFYAGRFYPKTGLLMLAANPQAGGTLKFALTINHKINGVYQVEGIAFSSENAVVSPLVLEGVPVRGAQ